MTPMNTFPAPPPPDLLCPNCWRLRHTPHQVQRREQTDDAEQCGMRARSDRTRSSHGRATALPSRSVMRPSPGWFQSESSPPGRYPPSDSGPHLRLRLTPAQDRSARSERSLSASRAAGTKRSSLSSERHRPGQWTHSGAGRVRPRRRSRVSLECGGPVQQDSLRSKYARVLRPLGAHRSVDCVDACPGACACGPALRGASGRTVGGV